MKTRSICFFALFALTALAFISGCSPKKEEGPRNQQRTQETETSSAQLKEAAKPRFDVSESFQQQLSEVFSSYVALKNAFVSSDAAAVKKEARDTERALADVDMTLLSGAAHNDWMSYLTPIQSSLKEIAAADEIETQRRAFSTLSENLYKSIRAFGLGGKEAFYEFCPMAFDNDGAYWLSESERIRNPYFGDKMLTCGEVKERLQ